MSLKIKGAAALQKRLADLAKKDARRISRAAARSAVAAQAKVIKAHVPVDEGVLKKATSYKVYSKGVNSGGTAGADIDKARDGDKRPYNVDFLVNNGHVAPDGVFVPGKHYMEAAAPEAIAAGEATYIARLKEQFKAL